MFISSVSDSMSCNDGRRLHTRWCSDGKARSPSLRWWW